MNLHPPTPKAHARLDTRGARIFAVRKALNLTVISAAKYTGVSRQTFGKWEKDKVEDCDVGALGRFCEVADVNLDWLVSGRGKRPAILRSGTGSREDWHSGDETKPIPEITGSMAAHAQELNKSPLKHWVIPPDIMTVAFNTEPEHAVIMRVVTTDQVAERGDYFIIDTSRTKFDDAGAYLVTDCGEAAFRIELEWTEGTLTPKYDQATNAGWRDLKVLGRVMAFVRQT